MRNVSWFLELASFNDLIDTHVDCEVSNLTTVARSRRGRKAGRSSNRSSRSSRRLCGIIGVDPRDDHPVDGCSNPFISLPFLQVPLHHWHSGVHYLVLERRSRNRGCRISCRRTSYVPAIRANSTETQCRSFAARGSTDCRFRGSNGNDFGIGGSESDCRRGLPSGGFGNNRAKAGGNHRMLGNMARSLGNSNDRDSLRNSKVVCHENGDAGLRRSDPTISCTRSIPAVMITWRRQGSNTANCRIRGDSDSDIDCLWRQFDQVGDGNSWSLLKDVAGAVPAIG